MSLSVTCPRCESKYQLDAGMRGKKMRCPNPICRAVFEVRDDSDAPAPSVEAPKAQEVKPAPVPAPPVEATPKEPPPIVAKPVEAKKPEPVKQKPVPKP